MRFEGLATFLLLAIGFSVPAIAGMRIEDVFSEAQLVSRSQYDVVVITIIDVEKRQATNGNPPKLKIKIEKVLRGSIVPGEYLAVWSSGFHDVDYAGGDSEERKNQWFNAPLELPTEGAKMIVIGKVWNGTIPASGSSMPYSWESNNGKFLIEARCRYTYSEDREVRVLEKIKNEPMPSILIAP